MCINVYIFYIFIFIVYILYTFLPLGGFFMDIVKIDPFLYGYFSDETLEHGERVGLALLHAAQNIEIRFSHNFLPQNALHEPAARIFALPSAHKKM